MDRIYLLLIHLIAKVTGVNMAFEVRFLSAHLSKASTTGVLVRAYSSPSPALKEISRIRKSRSEPHVEGHYFIQIKARVCTHYQSEGAG